MTSMKSNHPDDPPDPESVSSPGPTPALGAGGPPSGLPPLPSGNEPNESRRRLQLELAQRNTAPGNQN